MSPAIWTAAIATIGAVVGGLAAAIVNARSSPYAALSERVARLEEQVQTLLSEQGVDRAHIIDVHWWDHVGRPGSIPSPPAWYRDRHPVAGREES